MDTRMRFGRWWVGALIGLVGMGGMARAQEFGKNKVQYKRFDWRYIQSPHFDVFYYGEAKPLAEFAADVAESSLVALKRDFRFDPEKRIPILIYTGHNDFQQTNVTLEEIEESVGGFTEIFKDRVVIPFQGHYEDFRHVIHHELTHAISFQFFYGGGVGNRVTNLARFQMPLWFAEGLAEYQSLGWDTKSDMYMRDATLQGYVPPIPRLSGFLVYKGGQSLFQYIADTYGEEKVGELIGKVRLSRSVENGVRQSLGIDLEALSERWHKHLRRTYWPDIQGRKEPDEMARRLTDHTKKNHFLNGSPALSPKGDRLVYLTDQNDYIDIRMMRTIDGKDLGRLVKGQRSDLFEQMHWLRPGMSWSPDGSRIVFAAKAGPADRLYILDVQRRKVIRHYRFDLDGIYSPAWSPDGRRIAFMGLNGIQSDLYLLDVEKGTIERITDDLFSDLDPAWSPDGKEIVFVSDRRDILGEQPPGFRMQHHDYRQQDVYVIHVETREIIRLTDTEADEKSPVFSPDGRWVAYISDISGVDNIYLYHRDRKQAHPITNLMTGIAQVTWSADGSRMVFSAFAKGGYDLFLINNPLEIPSDAIHVEATAFMKWRRAQRESPRQAVPIEVPSGKYQNYVFGKEFREGRIRTSDWERRTLPDTSYKEASGEYRTQKYKLRFTPDMITGGAGYSQFYGLQGSSLILLSDILGNHQIALYTDLFYNLKNSNFMAGYYYLPRQTDVGISLFQYSYLYYTYFVWYDPEYGYNLYYGYLRDRNYGASLSLSRPFSRFRRVDFSATYLAIDRDLEALNFYYPYYGEYSYHLGTIYQKRSLFFGAGYTTDTVIWGETAPIGGRRSNLSLLYSPQIDRERGFSFYSARADWRNYLRMGRRTGLAVRVAAGFSDGRHPQRFLLGGMTNWINYAYRDVFDEILDEDLFFFSSFEGPLRGTVYYEMIGSRFVLTNFEFRFPLIQYLIFGGPLRFGLRNIQGVAFYDMGSAWSSNRRWKPFTEGPSGFPRLRDMCAGVGFGVRMNLGFLILRYDLAWPTDLAWTKRTPVHYWSLGADY